MKMHYAFDLFFFLWDGTFYISIRLQYNTTINNPRSPDLLETTKTKEKKKKKKKERLTKEFHISNSNEQVTTAMIVSRVPRSELWGRERHGKWFNTWEHKPVERLWTFRPKQTRCGSQGIGSPPRLSMTSAGVGVFLTQKSCAPTLASLQHRH